MKKLFCRKCGKRLTNRVDGDFRYDLKTGKKFYKLRCVDWRLLTEAEIGNRYIVGDPDNGHGDEYVF